MAVVGKVDKVEIDEKLREKKRLIHKAMWLNTLLSSWGTDRIFAAKIERSWVGYFNNFCIKVRLCFWLITKVNYSHTQTEYNRSLHVFSVDARAAFGIHSL